MRRDGQTCFSIFFLVALFCWFITVNLPSVPTKLENRVLSGSDEQLGCLCLAASLLYGASLTFLLSSTCLCEQSTNQERQSVSVMSELWRHLWMIDKSTKIYTLLIPVLQHNNYLIWSGLGSGFILIRFQLFVFMNNFLLLFWTVTVSVWRIFSSKIIRQML